MGLNYNNMANTALRLITENGRNVVFVRPVAGVYNATTGITAKDPNEKPKKFTVRGVLSAFNRGLIDGTVIKAEDMQLLIAANFKPEITDEVFIDGKKVGNIIAPITEVNPGGTSLMYRLQIRQGK